MKDHICSPNTYPDCCYPSSEGTVAMTEKQKDDFISVAQMGIACGLNHPFEWLNNYLMHMPNLEVYDTIPRREGEVCEAFIWFFRGCESGPDDPMMEIKNKRDLLGAMDKWYDAVKRGTKDDG